MNKILLIAGLILCLGVGIFAAVMTVMAAIFMEYGRVVFYMCLACICLPLAVVCFLNLRNRKS